MSLGSPSSRTFWSASDSQSRNLSKSAFNNEEDSDEETTTDSAKKEDNKKSSDKDKEASSKDSSEGSKAFKRISTEEMKFDRNLDSILQNNQAWVDKQIARNGPDYFKSELSKPQKPEILYVGCSDSRVPANEIMGLGPGEVFVHRNVANLVVPTDCNFGSVLQYAVSTLDVKHIVVCGHYDCGGVRASMHQATTNSDLVDGWLMHIRDVYRLYQYELDTIADEEQRFRRLVELNVIEQCINIFKFTTVQLKRDRATKKDTEVPYVYPRVHGLVFDPATGKLKKLKLNLKEKFSHLKQIYKLKQVDEDTLLVGKDWVEEWAARQNSKWD